MRKITIIDGHPDPERAHLIHALADRYAATAHSLGHDVRRINVAEMDVPLLRVPADFLTGEAPPAAREAQQAITWPDHVAFFFPLWHGYLPAAFKAFIEQVFRPGFAMEYNGEKRFPKGMLGQKSARIVVTMAMPAFVYRSVFGAHGLKAFELGTLKFAGVRPIHATLLGGAGDGIAEKASQWLTLMERLATSDGEIVIPEAQPLLPKIAKTAAVLGGASAAGIAAWRYGTSRRE